MKIKNVVVVLALLAVVASANAGLIITGIVHAEYDGGKQLRAIEVYADGNVQIVAGNIRLHRSLDGVGWTNVWNMFNKTYKDTFFYLVETQYLANFQEVFGTTGIYANVHTHTSVTADGNDAFRLRDNVAGATIDTVWYPAGGANGYYQSWMYRKNGTFADGDYWTINGNNPNWMNVGNNGSLAGMNAAQIRAAVPFGTYTTIPEPATLVLLGLGSSLLFVRRK